jgi:aspartyl-tRNA(Asn)/glutamyl-tRNA(Gln) amidotransferase subunit C
VLHAFPEQEVPVAITAADVARLGELARIRLTAEETETLAPQLDVILGAVATVSEVAGADVPPTSHALDLTNVFRPDVVQPSLTAEAVLAAAPATQGGRFRVPRILGEAQ